MLRMLQKSRSHSELWGAAVTPVRSVVAKVANTAVTTAGFPRNPHHDDTGVIDRPS